VISWKDVRAKWSAWSSTRAGTSASPEASSGEQHLSLARDSLTRLLDDPSVPAEVRDTLSGEYAAIQNLLEKIDNDEVHIAVLGRVSVGKSSLLNALLGSPVFTTSPLHGETRVTGRSAWQGYDAGGIFLIDTPGLDEVDGERREALAWEAASQADLILFVVDGDLTHSELAALRQLRETSSIVLMVLNKADRYSEAERKTLVETLTRRTAGLVEATNIITASAAPAERHVIVVDADGQERETTRRPPPQVATLVERLWQIIEREGKSLSALNASLFASRVSERITRTIMETRRQLAERLIRYYCIAKGLSVAVNPIPLADLAAAAAIDSVLVAHLSRLYDLPMSRREAGRLVAAIFTQLAALIGAVWTVHLASSALKLTSAGLSTLITASSQGAIAYYSTYVVGRIARQYLEQGKSWGAGGAKAVTAEILASMDRASIIESAREDILDRLKRRPRDTQQATDD